MTVDTTPCEIPKTVSETGNRSPYRALNRSSFWLFSIDFCPALYYALRGLSFFPIFSDVIDLPGHRGHLPGDCYFQ